MERKIEIPTTFDVESRGMALVIDLAKLSDAVLAQAVLHGLKQKIADAASGALKATVEGMSKHDVPAFLASESGKRQIAENGFAMMQKAYDALCDGDWKAERASAAPADPVGALAQKTAKVVLLDAFKARTGKGKIKDMVADDAVAKFFRDGPNGPVWDEEAVGLWIDAQAKTGKRDFRAEAKQTLEGEAKLDLDF